MSAGLRIALQVPLYAAFAAFIGYFSTSPSFEPIAAGHALIRLSLNHAGELKAPCRKRTPEELARMAPNMRVAEDCPRERAPVRVQVELDGNTVADVVAPPSGLARDGVSVAYRRIPVAAGEHRVRVRLANDAGGDYKVERQQTVSLVAGRVLLIDVGPGADGIVLR